MSIARYLWGMPICLALLTQPVFATDQSTLTFQDLLKMPVGAQGLEISPFAWRMQGQKIRLIGYMVQSELHGVGEFYFAAMPLHISEWADGPANDLPASTVLVKLDPHQKHWLVEHKSGAFALEGTWSVGRQEDAKGTVSWFQLQLPVDAVLEQPNAVATQQSHKHAHALIR